MIRLPTLLHAAACHGLCLDYAFTQHSKACHTAAREVGRILQNFRIDTLVQTNRCRRQWCCESSGSSRSSSRKTRICCWCIASNQWCWPPGTRCRTSSLGCIRTCSWHQQHHRIAKAAPSSSEHSLGCWLERLLQTSHSCYRIGHKIDQTSRCRQSPGQNQNN